MDPINYNTGEGPHITSDYYRPVYEKAEIWFTEPLKRMKDDDAFVFLMVCFPLLETIIRAELEIPDVNDVAFSENSKALKWFADFMTIPEANARDIWDAFRNGLLHRAMVKSTLSYELTGISKGKPADVTNGLVTLYVWDFRDKLVTKLEKHHKKLWNKDGNTLPRIYVRA